MAEFDLTSKIGQYLDRHLVFPLLEFLSVKEIYNDREMLQGKLDLLSNTNMVDFAMDVYRSLHGDEEVPIARSDIRTSIESQTTVNQDVLDKVQKQVNQQPDETFGHLSEVGHLLEVGQRDVLDIATAMLRDKRVHVVAELKKLQSDTEPIMKIFTDPEVISQIQNARDGRHLFDCLETSHGFQSEMLDTLYAYAKFQYECGNYSGAAEYLYFHRVLVPSGDKKSVSSLWGKLASEILMQNWDAALEDLQRLQEVIDANTFVTPLQSLQQRTWLIHWSLFVYFNHPEGRDYIIDKFLYQPAYLNCIQTTCPHILRYLTTAVITNKNRRRQVLKDLVKVIQQESYTYRDPITEFVECLYVNFDFDGAQHKLRECETVLVNDFFLVACLEDFIENARLFIFETFCRIHNCISINMLAEKLNMQSDEAERWIVNLIRNARLDAKIDSKLGHVVMGTQNISPYQQVIEKTKNLVFRSQALVTALEKKETQLKQQAGRETRQQQAPSDPYGAWEG